MKIGFFDSGLGGLIILKAVAKLLPQYDYEYFGDTANVPYGDKTEAEIFALTKAGVEHLFQRECALVIIACNTASADTLRKLQDTILVGEYEDKRILGVIIPTVETVKDSGVKEVMLFATKRTVESQKYNKEFKKLDSSLQLNAKALPELVPLIESGEWDKAEEMLCAETKQVIEAGCKDIILGCTHYSLLKDKVRVVAGVGEVYSQDEIIPQKVADYLQRHPEITQKLSNTGKREIVITKHNPHYDRLTAEFLGGIYLPEVD
jgi:glutamate racemase